MGINPGVRSAQTGKVVFGTMGANCGLRCPPPGPFEAEVALQMNVTAGTYALETTVRNTASSSDAATGPMAYLQVAAGAAFEGTTQLNAEIRLVAGAEDVVVVEPVPQLVRT